MLRHAPTGQVIGLDWPSVMAMVGEGYIHWIVTVLLAAAESAVLAAVRTAEEKD